MNHICTNNTLVSIVMVNKLIYLLDNNSIHRQMIRFFLLRAGFNNTTALNGQDELFYLVEKNRIPDFIVLDFNVISKEPLIFLQRIKQTAPSTCIIFFTDNEDNALAGMLMRNGATDYILKGGSELKGLSELTKNLKYLISVAELS